MNLDQIKTVITETPVTLFMKGTKSAPQCGFSSMVVQILDAIGVEFKDFDVLADSELRENIKLHSNWPTIPQLYIDTEFIGGADIVRNLAEKGELQKILLDKKLLPS